MNKRRKTTRRTSKSSFQMPKMPSIEIKKSTQNELVGVIYILLAVVATMSLLGLAGPLGYLIVGGLTYLFGIAVWLFPIIFFAMGLVLVMFHKRYGVSSAKILGLILITCAILGFIHITGGTYGTGGDYQLAGYEESAELGGLIGFITATTLYFPLQETATKVILVFAFLAGIILVFDLSLYNIFRMFKNGTPKIITKDDDVEVRGQANKLRVVAPKSTAKVETKPEKPQTEPKKKKGDLVRVLTNEPKKPKLNISLTSKKYTDWEFPSLDLLDSSTSSVVRDDKFLQEKAEQIKHKLEQFGINVTMQDVHLGPTVMQYTLRPSDGVKLSKITTLKSDLALALAAESVRIEAPIPGKALVGIEVPNKKRSTVRLHEILTSDEFRKTDSQLKIPIGSAADGTPIIGELDKMPHLLVAGQTGSGKSVGINTILVSLLYQNSPADLRLILVDPKRVELTPYNAIPHLLTPVIVEPEKTIAALRWAVSEMTRRYKLCAENHARNIKEYNAAHSDEKLPYVVIVIDELADLMMVAGKEVEALICRIAQMARAVGIHLIIATQRPSVDVITGLIKANIPTRVAFTVASGVDSRTIIDTVGAEDLLGMGDMLYLTSEIGKPVRVQGVYIDTEEVKRVTNKIKLTREPEYITEEIVEQPHEDVQIPGYQPVEATGNETDDELVEKAVQVMRETRKASASLFQRRLSLGYARAARILDLLEEKGYVGPVNGAKPREIFLPEEDNQNEPQG